MTVNGQLANAMEFEGGPSGAVASTAERDLLVTVARPDGAVNYIVFVAPEPDYPSLKPVFSSMAQSFRVR